jgi:hypothetical protein
VPGAGRLLLVAGYKFNKIPVIIEGSIVINYLVLINIDALVLKMH